MKSIKLNIDNPCKYIIWILQQKYLYKAKDYYNYTTTYRHKRNYDTSEDSNINVGDPLYPFDTNLITNETLLFNNKESHVFRQNKPKKKIVMDIISTKEIESTNAFKNINKSLQSIYLKRSNREIIDNEYQKLYAEDQRLLDTHKWSNNQLEAYKAKLLGDKSNEIDYSKLNLSTHFLNIY